MTAPSPADAAASKMVEVGFPGGMGPGSYRANMPGGPQRRAVYQSESDDPNPELRFPRSVIAYDQMSRTDGQVGAVLRAITLPLIRAGWDLNEKGCSREVCDFIRNDLGLPRPGETLPQRRISTVIWREHVREALESLTYGFAVFNQKYQPEFDRETMTLRMHLRKLSPRPQRTISEFEVAEDGGLMGVWQTRLPGSALTGGPMIGDLFIDVSQLVVYSHERRGADWSGQSILRTAYKHWMINEILLRIAAQVVERNGMGIPVVSYDPAKHTREDAEAIANGFRSGATAGIALPPGMTIQLIGVSGSIVDPLPLMKYQDEAIARAALQMFLNLGHDNGARSLGETFEDVGKMSLQSIGDWIASTATEHIIRELVEANWGPEEPYPTMTCGDVAEEALSPEQLVALTGGATPVVTPDKPLQTFVRDRFRLPKAEPVPEPAPVDPLSLINQPIPPSTTETVEIPQTSATAALAMTQFELELARRTLALAE